jgi:hypothetical protein
MRFSIPFQRLALGGFTLFAAVSSLAGCLAARPAWGAAPVAASRAVALAEPGDNALLDELERAHFRYFVDQVDPATGLARDRSTASAPASIAAVGFGLTAYPIAVRHGWVERAAAAESTRKVLQTLWQAPQGDAPEGMAGAHGLFYHFLDSHASRAWHCELSTIDTALLMAGVRFARDYYDQPGEADIRTLADQLYNRVDWAWATNGQDRVSLGWKPESGFLPYGWGGYNEGMVLMLLGLGSATHPLAASAWTAFTRDEHPVERFGQKYVPFAPLFGHQYSHAWVDFRGIKDAPMRALGFDYFENSRRATLAQHAYGLANSAGWKGYGDLDWGLTACDGPGDKTQALEGKTRQFFGYLARGAPDGPDDGTIAPTAAAASLPFAPEVVMPTLRHWRKDRPELWGPDGFADAFNPTANWVDPDRLGIDQGPIVLMLENHRTGFVWDVMRHDAALKTGLHRAGFTGGWLVGS